MRLSEFWALADDVFGPTYARSLARDLALDRFHSRTVTEVLEDGVPVRDVWHAWCEQMDVPSRLRDGGDRTRMIPPPR
ncbi:hypothetical protein GCM10025876_33220 [Demequina litorisediminis]|uniref:DUF3046 domain-containing protein n=1 Tax=Demequina litorisediminis TaxID=1849022 RepID=A0ABQ6IGY1_9MICO|nr:hypothetical protein GCM10025876_33220 [Demequina litorisediminis]